MKEKLIDFRNKQPVRLLFSILCVIFSALLQTYALKAFLRPAGLLSSGFTGLAILLNVIGSQHGLQIPVSLMIVILNLPVAILCGKFYNSIIFAICMRVNIFNSISIRSSI